MSEVDERVVQMKFDNAQFEAGVQQTLQSLNKLNDSIEKNTKANSGKSLTGLANAIDGLKDHFSNVESGVKDLTNTFSPLGIAGKAAIENITNKLTDLTLNCAKTLTGINSMREGFSKFSDKSMAVSTLMTATGASMNEVSKAMDNLNWFTDETSYNFTDMIDTMSKFSASGVKDLSKLTRTVEGIALWGAKAGANSQTVSRAMYQLSQAVGRGYITYQDWLQSAVNTNMATSEIKKQLLEAGGAAAKSAGAYQDFNNSLKKGWLTIDVFNKVMDQYTEGINQANYENGEFINSQNGAADATTKFSEAAFRNAQECKTWADVINAVQDAVSTSWGQTYEYIFGNYIESKKFFTALGNLAIDVASRVSDARNQIFSDWRDNGGREALIKSLVNTINALYRVIVPVVEAFGEVFGELNGKNLAGATSSLEAFTRSLLLSRAAMEKIKSTFIDIFTVIKSIYQIVRPFAGLIVSIMLITTVLSTVRSILSGGLGLGTILGILKIIASLGILKKLKAGSKLLNVITGVLKLVAAAVALIATAIGNLFKKISSSDIVSKIKSVLSIVKSIGSTVIAKIAQEVTKLWALIKSFNIGAKLIKLKEIFVEVGTVILEYLWKFFDFITGFTKLSVHAAEVGESFDQVGKKVEKATTPIEKIKATVESFLNLFKGKSDDAKEITDNIDTANSSLKNVNDTVKDVSKTTDAATSSVKGLSSLIGGFSTAFSKWLENVKNGNGIFKSFADTIKKTAPILSSINWDKILAVGTILLYIFAMKKLNQSVVVLTGTINNIVNSFQGIRDAASGMMYNIGGSFKTVATSIQMLLTTITKNYKLKWFKDIAIGVALLAGSLTVLGFVPWQNLIIGSVAIAAITTAIVLLARYIVKIQDAIDPAKMASLAISIVAITSSITTLAGVLGIIAIVSNHVISTSKNLGEVFLRLAAPLAILGAEIGMVAGFLVGLSKLTPWLLKLGAGIAAVSGSIILFSVSLISLQVALVAIKVLALQVVADVIEFVAVFKKLLTMKVDPKTLAVAVIAFSVLAEALLAFKIIAKGLSKITVDLAKSMALLAASMVLLALSCKVLTSVLSIADSGMANMGMMMVLFLGTIAALGTPVIQKGIENLKGIGKAALTLSAAMLILTGAIAILGHVDTGVLIKGVIGVSVTLISLGGALMLIKSQSGDLLKASAVILSFTFAMYALIPVIALFGAAGKVMAPGILLLSGLMLALAKSCNLLNKVNAPKVIGLMVTIGATLLGLMYVFEELSEIQNDKLLSIASSIAIVFGSIAVSVSILGAAIKAVDAAGLISMVVTLGTFTIMAEVLAEGMQKIAAVPYQNILSFAAVLGVLGVAVAGILAVIGYFGAALTVASPAITAFALVIAASAISMTAFGVAAVGFAYALKIGTEAIAAFIPAIEQFITFIVGLDGQALVIARISGALTLLGIALIPLGVGMSSTAIGVALLSGAAVVAAGAITLFGGAIALTQTALSNFLILFEQFMNYCNQMGENSENLFKMAGAITAIGLSLAPFTIFASTASLALGGLVISITLLGGGLTILAGGANLCSTAMSKLATSATKVSTSISSVKTTLTALSKEALTWGADMVKTYAKGMLSHKNTIANAANSIAKIIRSYLHFSKPDVGALSDADTYMPDMVKLFGSTLLGADTSSITSGVSNIADLLGSFKVEFANKGAELAESFGESLTSKISSVLSQAQDKLGNIPGIGGLITKVNNNFKTSQKKSEQEKKKKKRLADLDHQAKGNKKSSSINSDLDLTSYDDFLSKQDDLSSALGNSTDALNANTGALGSNKKAAGGSSSGSDKAAKSASELAEEEKMLAKYTKYATATMNAYMDVTGATIGLISNTSPVKVAQEAMHELAEQIYADTQKDSGSVADATESAKDHAKAVMEAFNKAFESIRDNVKNSIDLFTQFDTKFDELTNPDVVLKNAESQIEGVTRLGQKYMLLAEKGFSREIISDLESKGVEGLSKVNSLLKMNTEQALEYNAVQKKIDDVSTSVAAQAMAAQASAITISKLRQQVEEQKKIKASAKDLWDEYSEEFNKAKDAGADLTKTVYGNIDMNNRQVLKWTKENLDKYHDILKDSMHMTEEDINDLSGNISTVLGSWGTYGEEGIAIAFSPMLQTDHGAELLDNKTINNYIDMLVDKVNAEHPNGWVDADLLALDKKGMEVDGKFIQNIIADIGDTAEATSEQMHYVGIDSDVMHSYSKLQEMADNLGISVEDLGKKCYDTGMTAQEAALNLIEIHQKASTILQTFQDKYEGMKNTVKDLIQSQVGLFEKLELKTDTSAQDMINNFKSQVDGLKQWSAEFQSLAARGINDGLLKELGKAGPEGYEKLHAFYTMSSSELQQINNLYAQRLTLEDTVAQQIGTSYATAAVGGIQAYNQAIVNYTASGVLMNTAIAAAQQISDTLNTNGKRGGTTAGTNTATSLQQALQNMIAPLRSTATNVSNQTNNATKSHLNNNTGNEIGTNYLQGLLNGISNGSLRDQIIGTISSLASDMNAAMHNGLKERSPSKFTEQAGEYYFTGLLNGLKNTFNRPVDAVSDIAEQMNTTMQDALQTAVDLMNNSGDMQPTIRPVVDLSDAQNGSRLLSSMFSNIGPMRVNAGIGQITTPTDRMNAAIAGMSSCNSVTNGDIVLNIYATPGQNTKELADIVIKRLNNEYARRKAAWT